MPHKHLDVAVEAFNRLRLPLVVVGDGPDERRLKRLAGPTIRFAGRLTDADTVRTLQRARALVVTAKEEFGIAAVEAQAAGRPGHRAGRGRGPRHGPRRRDGHVLPRPRARGARRGRPALRRARGGPAGLRGQRPALRRARVPPRRRRRGRARAGRRPPAPPGDAAPPAAPRARAGPPRLSRAAPRAGARAGPGGP